MSLWSYVHGTVCVESIGRTQEEIEYILKIILAHQPIVSGSEKDMSTYLIKKNGYNMSSSHDEFDNRTNQVKLSRGLQMQSSYIIVVDGSLRDRMFNQTFKEFIKWLTRLSKRTMIDSVNVHISAYDNECDIKAMSYEDVKKKYDNFNRKNVDLLIDYNFDRKINNIVDNIEIKSGLDKNSIDKVKNVLYDMDTMYDE